MGILAREVRHVPSWQRDGGEVPTPSRRSGSPSQAGAHGAPHPPPSLPRGLPGWHSLTSSVLGTCPLVGSQEVCGVA